MLSIAIQAVKNTRLYSINAFDNIKKFKLKFDQSFVTHADLYIESCIKKFLSIKTPNVPILGEEFGSTINHEFHTGWIIDPIDGTKAFLYGVPLFSTLLAYIENHEPVIGVIYFPILNKIIYANQGYGCWMQSGNSPAIKIIFKTNDKKRLRSSVISISGIHSTTFNSREGKKAYKLFNLIDFARDIIFINDCYQHIMVSTGRIDAAIDTLMKAWDIAALLPCMKESGVIYSNLQGSCEKLLWGKSFVTAASQTLLEEIVNALN
ncbi:inositol monophosphatase family protein [Candidatus Pantoea carbekii]|uniref:inositol monophosphatase family protein n=1 Tax=Candidatus Pantoea carbekii TaxID=1235990 RepID=UPI0006187871|nr:inositol monophosphatase [Candidatus Pantoea carbekii]AKC32617.1 inositol monophosphatase SuhB [Candidatus Pantoea carbekii]